VCCSLFHLHGMPALTQALTVIQQGTPLKGVKPSERIQELQGYISSLESGVAGKKTLQKLALLCIENPAAESISSPYSAEYSTPSPFAPPARSLPSLKSDMWAKDKNFDRMFKALMNYMHPSLVWTVLFRREEKCSHLRMLIG
jgi:CLIP-associating protein 1/2